MTQTTTETFALGGTTPVARIGFGAMQLPKWPTGTPVARDTALAVLNRAVELGVNHIDTASFYAKDGVSANELIKAALHPYPEGLVLATKVGPRFGPDGPTQTTPAQLREDVERNLTELGVDRLGLVNLRMNSRGAYDGDIGPLFEALAALREEGLIEHLGVSNVTAGPVAQAQRIAPLAGVQNYYNLVHRGDDDMVDALAGQGVAYVPFFPLGGHVDRDFLSDEVFSTVAKRHGATAAQVALAWTLRRSPSILLIPGTGSVGHLEENMAVADLELTGDDLELLNTIR